MDTSSDDSFAWTSTSNDDSCAEPMLAYEEESDFGKSFKKKLQKELFQNGDHEEPEQETPRARKKKVKREPASPAAADDAGAEPASPPAADDAGAEREVKREPGRKRRLSVAASPDHDGPRRSKKARRDRSREPLVNGDLADAERLLRLKVKQERASLPAPSAALQSEEETSRKKKKAKRARSPKPAVDAEPADAEEPPPKKKKKKHKRETLDETPAALVEKFEAAETVVEARRASPSPSPDRARAPPAAATPRALKIRERITFEEDSVDRAESEPEPDSEGDRGPPAPGAEPAGRLARYLRAHATRRALPAGAGGGCALGPDDDVWLLRAPRSLRPAALQGAALPLGRGRLKAGGRSYDVAPADGGARAALLLAAGGWRARGVRLCGTLAVRVRVPRARTAPAVSPPPPPAAPPPLPATRARHPLLGVDFESALAPRPRPRHPTEDDNSRDAEKTKKKKKKKKREREQRDAEAEPAPEPEPGPGRRRRAPERWDSERAIEESLFGS